MLGRTATSLLRQAPLTPLLKPSSSLLSPSRQAFFRTSTHHHQQHHHQHQQHQHQQQNQWQKVFVGGVCLAGGAAVLGAPPAPNSNKCEDQKPFVESLTKALSSSSSSSSSSLVLSNAPLIQSYLKGIRLGRGEAIAVVRPKNMEELIRCVAVCAEYGVAIVPQGRNTGLTGGSVPRDEKKNSTDRPCVVLSTELISGITLLDPEKEQQNGDKQALCLAGTGIQTLQNTLGGKEGLASHSTLGSLFLNPTVAAGVAFGSGGTLLRVGPSYTDRILSLRINQNGEVEVVSTLGAKGNGDSLKDLLQSVQSGEEFSKQYDPSSRIQTTYVIPKGEGDFSSVKGADEHHFSSPEGALCSMKSYPESVCNLDNTVSRYNADTSGELPVRSEGKCLILASIHDAPKQPLKTNFVWISCDSFETAVKIKKRVALDNPQDLPVMCEYMNKDAIISTSAGGTVLMYILQYLGMQKLAYLWGIKSKLDVSPVFGGGKIDRAMVWVSQKLAPPIPKPVEEMTQQFDHHLLINVAEFGTGELQRQHERARKVLEEVGSEKMVIYEAKTPHEAAQMKHFRFVITAAFGAYCKAKGLNGISVDYALQKGDDSIPKLPENTPTPDLRLRYMHFGCNVVHEDIAFTPEKTSDPTGIKLGFKANIEKNHGAKLPAEHGHGIEYRVPADMVGRWKKLDPLNLFNPGIGYTSPLPCYGEKDPREAKEENQ